MRQLIPLVILILVSLTACQDYSNQDKWGELCETGINQSPINITRDIILPCDPTFTFSINISDHKYIQPPYDKSNKNNMKTPFNQSTIHTSNKGINKIYHSIQFHFHHQAEHQINGVVNDIQLHIVHQAEDSQYAVFSTLFKAQSGEFPDLFDNWILDLEAERQEQFPLRGIAPFTVYHYIGSLTTPGCDEGVQWFINEQVLKIKESTYRNLSLLINRGEQNKRSTQNLNGRKVYQSGLICSFPHQISTSQLHLRSYHHQ